MQAPEETRGEEIVFELVTAKKGFRV